MRKITTYTAPAALALTIVGCNPQDASAAPPRPTVTVGISPLALTSTGSPQDAVPAAENIDAQADFDNAVGNASNELGLATGVGMLLGTGVGSAGGCVAGAVVGATLMPPAFLPGAAGGCLAGAIAGITLGTASGVLGLGIPVGISAGTRFFQTIDTPAAPHADTGTPADGGASAADNSGATPDAVAAL